MDGTDRYAEAVAARRRELHALRELLAGGHRAQLRNCLALSRLAATRDAAAAFAELRREAVEHAERGDRSCRAALRDRVESAVAEVADAVARRWARALRPALRRIATERGLMMAPGWPRLPPPRLEPLPPPRSAPPGGLTDGAVPGRLALVPLTLLPTVALGRTAPGIAVIAVVCALGVGVLAWQNAARARLRRNTEDLLRTAAAVVGADLDRRLVELEGQVAAALDTAVARRRATVDQELIRLRAATAPD